MKVNCDKCGAVYRIPEEKLTKDVSRATCKKCGNKIVIRKPSAAEGGLAGSYGFDDDEDAVVNHEERTVIATVPELQRFDATPPLSVPGSSTGDEDGDDLLAPTPAPAKPAVTATQNVSSTAPAAPSAAAQAEEPSSVPRPSGVPIPGQIRLDIGIAPLLLSVVALVGTFLFLDHWQWSQTRLTAVGFGLAIYGQVAVLMALLDIRAQRAPRPPLVYGVPAMIVVLVFLVLLLIGKDKMAFLEHSAPAVAVLSEGPDSELFDYEYETVYDEKTGESQKVKVRRPKKPKSTLPAQAETQQLGLGTGTVDAATDPNVGGPAVNPGAAELMAGQPRTGGGPESGLDAKRAELQKVKVSPAAISRIIGSDEGVARCISLHSAGMSGALMYQLEMLPTGAVKDAHFEKSSAYYRSELERCLTDRVKRLSFPEFAGTEAAMVTHKFLF